MLQHHNFEGVFAVGVDKPEAEIGELLHNFGIQKPEHVHGLELIDHILILVVVFGHIGLLLELVQHQLIGGCVEHVRQRAGDEQSPRIVLQVDFWLGANLRAQGNFFQNLQKAVNSLAVFGVPKFQNELLRHLQFLLQYINYPPKLSSPF